MLYSTTTSAILRIDTTSKQPLTVTDLPNAPLPTSSGPQARDTAAPASSTNAESSTAGGLGGAFSGLGGYVGLGGKAAVPVGTRTFGGEVLLGRQGETYRQSIVRKGLTSQNKAVSILLKAISRGKNQYSGRPLSNLSVGTFLVCPDTFLTV